MTTCPVCVRRDAARPPDVVTPAGGGALLLRVWNEDGLRARLLGVDAPYRTVATAQGADEICAAVRAWLGRL